MKKIGIIGGTFNPIHTGHMILAEQAYRQLKLDKILFMPSKKPPHKDNKIILDEEIRSEMVRLAINDNTHFEFSDLELKRDKTTYTADTLVELHSMEEAEYYFIMGADSYAYLDKWYKPEVIMKLAHIVVAVRDDVRTDDLEQITDKLVKLYDAKTHLLKMSNIEISSSEIRNSILESNDFNRYLVPDKVYKYIINHKLYQTYDM